MLPTFDQKNDFRIRQGPPGISSLEATTIAKNGKDDKKTALKTGLVQPAKMIGLQR